MRKMLFAAVGTVLLSCAAFGQKAPSGAPSCEGLAQLELPQAKILSAQIVTRPRPRCRERSESAA